jgi:hypothetical protein
MYTIPELQRCSREKTMQSKLDRDAKFHGHYMVYSPQPIKKAIVVPHDIVVRPIVTTLFSEYLNNPTELREEKGRNTFFSPTMTDRGETAVLKLIRDKRDFFLKLIVYVPETVLNKVYQEKTGSNKRLQVIFFPKSFKQAHPFLKSE